MTHKLRLSLVLTIAIVSLARNGHAAEPLENSRARPAQSSPWEFSPDPALPNVLILGDSISIGYTLQVRELLKGQANVFRPMMTRNPTLKGKPLRVENCQGTTHGLKRIDEWLQGRKWAVIHFNFGLHDLKHVVEPGSSKNSKDPNAPYQATVEQYAKNLEHIVQRLQATEARLIFATTTPVVPDVQGVPREPEAPPRYNAAALKIMQVNDIRVNNLYAYCLPHLDTWQQPRNVHFNREGSQALAKQVAKVIEEELREAE